MHFGKVATPLGFVSKAFNNFYQDKKVLVTGHTGFKGAWLSQWLLDLGAQVVGLSQSKTGKETLYNQLGLEKEIEHQIADIRDSSSIKKIIEQTQPDLLFHLAAQPLVIDSYKDPIDTYAANVMGTVNVLDGLRGLDKICSSVFVTTDKCYENKGWTYGYRENDPLGGHDPYSSSKACAEIAVNSFRQSFFNSNTPGLIGVASGRSGNVIGGGDWAENRLIPDCVRSLCAKEPIVVRNPAAIRPWQHVLESVSGYLVLAKRVHELLELQVDYEDLNEVCSAFNFGPGIEDVRCVRDCVEEILKHWPGEWRHDSEVVKLHEAHLLSLNIEKAHKILNWQPVWSFRDTIAHTVQWYRQVCEAKESPKDLILSQISKYVDNAGTQKKSWTL